MARMNIVKVMHFKTKLYSCGHIVGSPLPCGRWEETREAKHNSTVIEICNGTMLTVVPKYNSLRKMHTLQIRKGNI